MADDSMALLERLRKASAGSDVDVLREGVRILAQAIMEAEVTEVTGVARGERDPERRLAHRNGYRDRRWDTRIGPIDLAVPRVRDGSYFPSLLDPRRRTELALLAVVQPGSRRGDPTDGPVTVCPVRTARLHPRRRFRRRHARGDDASALIHNAR